MLNIDTEGALSRLRHSEGLRLQPYRCPAGKLTIGYGRNLEDRGITVAEAEMMLESDVDYAMQAVDRAIPFASRLDPVRQEVLVDMAFNMGIGGLLGFPKMLAHMAAGDFEKAAQEAENSRWYKQVGRRAVENVKAIRTGRWGE